ncbi:MAG TPA: RNA-binding cell elongation regulator Jag/EloR, partial [Turneriella sp.]|nr:RNA-binding cell elongation regulator Jag/EloR [Turneriella sp.]
MQILEIEALDEKEALKKGIEYLGVDAESIELSVLKKGSSGFLGLGQKTAGLYKISAIRGKTPLAVIIRGVISTILGHIGYTVTVKDYTKVEEGKLMVTLEREYAGYIIGKHGRTLEALQFMTNLIVEKITGEQPKILLDIENYRERRAQHLMEIARKTGEYVLRTGKSRLLDPLNPYERRLVHMALQDNEHIKTESEGNGVYKRVRIFRVSSGAPAETSNELVTEENIGNIQFEAGEDPEGAEDIEFKD